MPKAGAAGLTHLRNSFLHFRRRRLPAVRHQEQKEHNIGLFLAVAVDARHSMSLLVKAEESA
jgi:hypothetical protein